MVKVFTFIFGPDKLIKTVNFVSSFYFDVVASFVCLVRTEKRFKILIAALKIFYQHGNVLKPLRLM